MKYFLLPLILGLIAVSGLNLYQDTDGRWWRTNFNFSSNWHNDEVWVRPLQIDERKPRMQHIPMLDKIDVLGLGSSRMYNLETAMLQSNVRFYNASVSGATLWDHVALWEQFKQSHNIPKHIILYLDTWNFNQNTWQKYRWIGSFSSVIQFLDDAVPDKSKRIKLKAEAYHQLLSGHFFKFSDLFSPAVMKVSFQEFLIRWQQGELKTNYITKLSDRPDDFPAWKNDGTHLFSTEYDIPKSLEEINEMGRNVGRGSMNVYMQDWKDDESSIALLGYLLADAKAHGVDVLLVQPPFQHVAYDILMSSHDYKKIPDRYSAIISSILKAHDNASYCNASNPRTIDCNETEFMDSSHVLSSCAKKLIAYCTKSTTH
jgi:hypothetical protein